MIYQASGTVEFGEFCVMMKTKFSNTRDGTELSEECELREAFKYTFISLQLESYNSSN